MREILFKAKRIDNGEWIFGDLSHHKTGRVFIKPLNGSAISTCEVDKDTICQYTGLTDKNGQKIWENDIVRIKYDDDFSEVGWIKYSNCGVRYNFVFGTEIYSIDDSCNIEVIGNIFDNPELINE